MIRVLLLIRFDELHFYVRNVWAKYTLMNGIFTIVMFEEHKLGLGSLSVHVFEYVRCIIESVHQFIKIGRVHYVYRVNEVAFYDRLVPGLV